MTTATEVSFRYSLDELESLREPYEDLAEDAKRLLNQIVHDAGALGTTDPDGLPHSYRGDFEFLLNHDLVEYTVDDELNVPIDVVYLPDGPGCRRDQLPGVLHRLPDSQVRGWFKLMGGEEVDELDRKLLHRRLASEVLSGSPSEEIDRYLKDEFGDEPWITFDELTSDLNDSLNNFYTRLGTEDPIHRALRNGFVFPVWNDADTVTGLVRADRTIDRLGSVSLSCDDEVPSDEKNWDRSPFGLAEQLKIMLIVNDALPMRLTEDRTPHRFDLKEAARITDWELDHVDYLTNLVLEHDFLRSGDGRYLITDRYQGWENSDFSIRPLITSLTLPLSDHEDEVRKGDDLSFGQLLRSVLTHLTDLDNGLTTEAFVRQFRNHESVSRCLLAGPFTPVTASDRLESLLGQSLRLLYWLGLCDRWSEQQTRYRINERGRALVERSELAIETEDDLPLILQPDGQLMLPLECPMETFRHVNPFGLLAKVDRMIVYQIDDKSLVQALNEGWDAQGFRGFLEDNVRELPNPMRELFDDILEDVEDVSIREVHHLLEFETGATAAKAMNILNNYNPARIDETTVVLQSETTEETIRRNLSRGGIRLRTDSEQGALSPLIEGEE